MLPNSFFEKAKKVSFHKQRSNNTNDNVENKIESIKNVVEQLKSFRLQENLDANTDITYSEIMNRSIRQATDLYIKMISAPNGAQYYEQGIDKAEGKVFEHVIPLENHLIPMYMHDLITFDVMIRMPTCKISKKNDKLLLGNLKDTNTNIEFPFQRYLVAGIQTNFIKTNGEVIDPNKFSLRDHFEYFIQNKILKEQEAVWNRGK